MDDPAISGAIATLSSAIATAILMFAAYNWPRGSRRRRRRRDEDERSRRELDDQDSDLDEDGDEIDA